MDYTCNFLFVGDKIQNMRLYTHLFFASGRWISQEYAERCVKQVNDGDDAKHPASRRSRAHYDTYVLATGIMRSYMCRNCML